MFTKIDFFQKRYIKITLRGIILCGFLAACSSHQHGVDQQLGSFQLLSEQPNIYISANFGPDGKLWRVLTSKKFVYVDYSLDNGKTFTPPIQINTDSQTIKSSSENRPSIAIDSRNYIYVVYAAEGQKPATLYLSTSLDGGKTFSAPKLLSNKADQSNTFQGTLAVNKLDQPYIFWHDDRDRTHYAQLGNSIYYTNISDGITPSLNQKASDVLCECCRLAVDFDVDNEPVVLGRFIYDQVARDHGLLKINNQVWQSWRVTYDDWRVEACPEQGPALSISDNGDYHIVWLTQGNVRKGLFYSYSNDHGQQFSMPLRVGSYEKLANNPAIISKGKNVTLAWIEFDGESSQLLVMQSQDGGKTWKPSKLIASSKSTADRPFFVLKNHQAIFLAWTTKKDDFRLFEMSGV